MADLQTSISHLILVQPVPERDAAFAYNWFQSDSGRDTSLKMGNSPDEIKQSTIEGEFETIEEFLKLEREGKQKTWMIRYEATTIGAAWIDLIENHGVKAPSVHLMIGDPVYRGKGIGKATMQAMISYLEQSGYSIIYSRHLSSNKAVTGLNRSLGFQKDGQPYIDKNVLEWQNVKLACCP